MRKLFNKIKNLSNYNNYDLRGKNPETDLQKRFIAAAINGDNQELKRCLDIDVYPYVHNFEYPNFKNAMCYAIEKNNIEAIKLLLKNGFDINHKTVDGLTILDYVSKIKKLDILEVFYEANVSFSNEQVEDALYDTSRAIFGWPEGFEFLMEKVPKISDKDILNQCFINACTNKKLGKFIPELIKQGANINAQYNRTALEGAANNGNIEVMRMLLDKGFKINTKSKPGGLTALHFASLNNNDDVETIKFLIDNGAKINLKDEYGRTPIHYAIKSGSVEKVRFLLENGADYKIKSLMGETLMDYAYSLNDDGISKAINFLKEYIEADQEKNLLGDFIDNVSDLYSRMRN